MATPIYQVSPQPSNEYPRYPHPPVSPEVVPAQPLTETTSTAAPQTQRPVSPQSRPEGRHLQMVQAALQEPAQAIQLASVNVGIEEAARSIPGRLQGMAEENSQPLDVYLMNLEASFAQGPAGPQP